MMKITNTPRSDCFRSQGSHKAVAGLQLGQMGMEQDFRGGSSAVSSFLEAERTTHSTQSRILGGLERVMDR